MPRNREELPNLRLATALRAVLNTPPWGGVLNTIEYAPFGGYEYTFYVGYPPFGEYEYTFYADLPRR
eukprot:4864698-Ditylum_brightwellii.AAC.1